MAHQVPKIAAIDIGSHKVSVMVGNVYSAEHIEIIAAAYTLNHGMSKGKITNLDKVVSAIKAAVQSVEEQTGQRIGSAWISIPSSEIVCEFASGHTNILNHEVNSNDLTRILDQAKSQKLDHERYLLKTLPLGYSIDYSDEWVDNPLNLSGTQITGYYQFLKAPINSLTNFTKVIQHANLTIDSDIVPSMLAMAESGLLPDERRYGVCLIDMGATTTSVSVYLKDNKLAYLKSFDMGGDLVTQEIAAIWRTTTEEAERIKIFHGSVDKDNIPADQGITIQTTTGTQYYGRKELALIVTSVYERMLDVIYRELYHHGLLSQVSHGIVLTGQAMQIEGAVNLVRRKFQLTVHLANPPRQLMSSNPDLMKKIQSPTYAAVSGLLLMSQQELPALGHEPELELTFIERCRKKWDELFDYLKKTF